MSEGELLLISYSPFSSSIILIAAFSLLFIDVSKLHLLWIAPLLHVIFEFIFAQKFVKEFDVASPADNTELKPTAIRRERTPLEEQWAKVLWAMRRTKNRRYVVGPLLRNIVVPEPVAGKISLRFKSASIKNQFLDEMQDQRSRSALKAAINDAYGGEFEVEIRSPREAVED